MKKLLALAILVSLGMGNAVSVLAAEKTVLSAGAEQTVDNSLLIQLSGKYIDIVIESKTDLSPFREEASDDRINHRYDLKEKTEQ